MKETLKKARYKYLYKQSKFNHVLLNLDTNEKELFTVNKNFSGWGLIYKNTHLEFCCTIY